MPFNKHINAKATIKLYSPNTSINVKKIVPTTNKMHHIIEMPIAMHVCRICSFDKI